MCVCVCVCVCVRARARRTGQAMRCGSFWALFTMFLTACACGLTLLNNLGPLVLALGGVPGGQVAFVSLFSVANASGEQIEGLLVMPDLRFAWVIGVACHTPKHH